MQFLVNHLIINYNISIVEGLQASVLKSVVDSARRSIEYCIKEEAKTTRAIFAVHINTTSTEQIMQEETINDLPKMDLKALQDFDNQLKTDLELIKKLVRIICLKAVQFY